MVSDDAVNWPWKQNNLHKSEIKQVSGPLASAPVSLYTLTRTDGNTGLYAVTDLGNNLGEGVGIAAPPLEHDPQVNETVDFGELDSKKVMFVTPPYERIAKGYEFVKHITNRSPSLGLLHLAAAVREEGYEPSILDVHGR